jgi:hypothetical protein
MAFVLLHSRMDPKPQKPSSLFANPFALWTELALKFWGVGKSPAPEKQVAVAVIPTSDAQPSPPAKAAPAQSTAKRTKGKVRAKNRSKRARR